MFRKLFALKGFLQGKSLWKAAFVAGQYTDVSTSTSFNEGEKCGKSAGQAMHEGQIHWAFSWIPLGVLHTSAQKLKKQSRKHTTLSSTWESKSRCWGICFCGGATSSSAVLEAQHTAEVTLPCSRCPSSVLNETFNVFRMWVISSFFVSKGHWVVLLFF